MVKISALTPDASPTVTDYASGVDAESSTTKRYLFSALITLFFNNVPNAILNALGLGTELAKGWLNAYNGTTTPVPNTVVYNGQGSYTLTFTGVDLTSYLNTTTRLKTTRTNAAPTQCTSLNGTTQYWVDSTSINKMAFTDDFVVSAWVKLSNYGSDAGIISRYNGTSGFFFSITSTGEVRLVGRNAGAANTSQVQSYQSVRLNKWVHITAQLDMSSFSASTTTSYIMFDGVDVPAFVTRGGTNPTALVQAGNLEVGSINAGGFFPGKIAQAAVFNAKVTQTTMQTYISQGLSGTETSLASAYSFNGVTTDLNTTTPNDLAAGAGSPTATNADSPFGTQASGLINSLLDYAIVISSVFSVDTTLTVSVPEGCTISTTSSGIAALSYSGQAAPYGFPSTLRFTLNAYNSSTTNALAALIAAHITPIALGPITYANAGTAGGSFTLELIGTKKYIRGSYSYSITGTGFQSQTLGVTFPTSFLSSTETALATSGNYGGTQFVFAGINSISTSTMSPYAIQANGTNGTGVIWYQVSGT